MSVLYLHDEGSSIKKNGDRLIVTKNNNELFPVPLEKLDAVVLFSGTHITSPAMVTLLEREIPVTWLSSKGKFFGRLEPTNSVNIERQRDQFRLGDDERFCLQISKSFISAKSKNSQVILRRYNRTFNYEEVRTAIEEIGIYINKIQIAGSVEELLGYEGNVSKLYFRSLGRMVNDNFKFEGRSKQPPKDPFNSLLSFGYTLLLYDIYTAICNKGLHPYAGFLHKIRKGHPALASDLMEEWRPVLVDTLVMSLVQGQTIHINDFEYSTETGGVYLNKNISKVFISNYESKMRQLNNYIKAIDYKISYREALQFQANLLTKAIEEKDYTIYEPILIR